MGWQVNPHLIMLHRRQQALRDQQEHEQRRLERPAEQRTANRKVRAQGVLEGRLTVDTYTYLVMGLLVILWLVDWLH